MSHERIDSANENEGSISSQARPEAGRAHKGLIYELFVLGELMDGPHHGYQLREILSNLLGPFRQISWGVLYPLIRQLEREGLLAYEDEPSTELREGGAASSRQRKRYVITAKGRERFYTLMLERGDYSAEYRELFTIKLNNFDYLSFKQQLVVLRQYQGCLQVEDLYLRDTQQHVSTDTNIPDHHRAHIFHIISFQWSSIRGEMQWIEQRIRHLEEEAGEAL
jgi:DNA-binding PadR family transcriptional regulator